MNGIMIQKFKNLIKSPDNSLTKELFILMGEIN